MILQTFQNKVKHKHLHSVYTETFMIRDHWVICKKNCTKTVAVVFVFYNDASLSFTPRCRCVLALAIDLNRPQAKAVSKSGLPSRSSISTLYYWYHFYWFILRETWVPIHAPSSVWFRLNTRYRSVYLWKFDCWKKKGALNVGTLRSDFADLSKITAVF